MTKTTGSTINLDLDDDLAALMALVEEAEAPRRKRARKAPARVATAVAYLRVSTAEQVESGLGIEAQLAAVEAEAERRGLRLTATLVDEGVSGSVPPEDRGQLTEALALLDSGKAGVLLVAKVDRLSRSLADLMVLLKAAERAGWCVVSADGLLDSCSLQGRIMGMVLGVVAEIEREFIRSRTREAMAAKRSRGERVGRPIDTPVPVRRRLAKLRASGLTLQAVAETLNGEGVTTAQGRRWSAGNVDRVIRSLRLEAELRQARA
jgi:DNA invertase Pin-like site-specific DNA recombinase